MTRKRTCSPPAEQPPCRWTRCWGAAREKTAATAGQASSRKENFHKKKRKHIQNFCTDLTAKARNGELDNIIGREKEIQRVVQILSRRTKNNPCLIGEPGVGKTAVAEGLALRIARGRSLPSCATREVQLLDLTALVAGTQFRGQFESRIKGLVDEVKADGNVILFIDEVHNLVGTGDAEGSMNAANILKPAPLPGGRSRSSAPPPSTSTGSTLRRTRP